MYDIGQAEIEAVTKVINSRQFMRYRGGEGRVYRAVLSRTCGTSLRCAMP